MNKHRNDCDIQNKGITCGAGISDGVIDKGVLVKVILLFGSIKFPKYCHNFGREVSVYNIFCHFLSDDF